MCRKHLLRFLSGKKNLRIPEINCGTGEDALWLSSMGHTVVATDQSADMIRIAINKSAHSTKKITPHFLQCPAEELVAVLQEEPFDLVFSNFAGLNCLAPDQLTALNNQLQQLITGEGYFAAVLFGKFTTWEIFYYTFKADFRKAFRRWRNKVVNVPLTETVSQPVYYYRPATFSLFFPCMKLQEKKPVGLLGPPSYREQAMQKRPRFFSVLKKLDNQLCRFSNLSVLADHTYLLLKKQPL
jgi:SAM-dependent methyltransferase